MAFKIIAATVKDLPPTSPAAKPHFARCYHQVQTNKQNRTILSFNQLISNYTSDRLAFISGTGVVWKESGANRLGMGTRWCWETNSFSWLY